MTTEPWGAYMPEVNAGRHETGVGVASWLASGAMWTDLAVLVGEAMAVMTAELAAVGINWHGLAPTAMGAAVAPFMSWLATMEATAAANALACYGVAQAFAIATGTMIPLPVVNMNRIAEAIAEATNFLGVNSGLILMLNEEYGRYWGTNGGTMVSYDEAVQAATIPKPASPPPPLANAAGAAAEVGQAAARAAAQQAIGASTDAATQAMGQTVENASQGTAQAANASEMPQSAMSSMLGAAGPLISMPGQAFGQVSGAGNTLTQPLQSLTSPLTSLLGEMGGSTTDAAGFGLGPGAADPFTGLNAAGSGLGDVGGSAMGGGGAVPLGGGLGGAMLGQTYMGASGAPVKSQQVFTGVADKPTPVMSPGAGGVGGGGGLAPMMHGAGGTTSSKGSASEPIIAVTENTNDGDQRI